MKFNLKYMSLIVLFFLSAVLLNAQNVSFNTDGSAPDNSAMLDVSDTTRGVLIPRLTIIQRNAITSPATGLLIFQTDSDSGFYFNQGIPATPNWLRLKTSEDTAIWNRNDTNIYFNDGFVGIGTDSAQGLLHLYGRGSLGAGSRLVFGDDYHYKSSMGLNTFIGESGWDLNTDSDQLQIHARNGTIFTSKSPGVSSNLDTAIIVNSFGINILGDTSQHGIILDTDSSYYALFTDNKSGNLLPQGALGIFGGHKTGVRDTRLMIDRDGKIGVGNNAPIDALQLGSSLKAEDQIFSIRTAGGNSYKSGIRLLHFTDPYGFSLISDEVENKFFIQSHNNDTTTILTIDQITKNVGIGTASPINNFQVDLDLGQFSLNDNLAGAGTLAGTTLLGEFRGNLLSPQLRYSNTNSGNYFDIGLDSNENFVIESNDNSLFTFRKEGWFNIGYDTTGFKLFIGDKAGGNTFTRMNTSTGQVGLWASNDSIGWALFSDLTIGGSLLPSGAVGLFLTNGAGAAWTVSKEGNMGIGTTTPTEKLDVEGNIFATGDNNSIIADDISNGRLGFLKQVGTGPVLAYSNNSDFIISQSDENNLRDNISSSTLTERFRITSSGNVGINDNTPDRTLDVNGDITINGRIYNDLNDRYIEINQQNTSSNNGAFTYGVANGAQLLPESSNNGTVGDWGREWNSIVGINVWRTYESTISDRRAKENIKPIENALSTLMKLRGVSYDFNKKTHPAFANGDTTGPPVHQLGFIAQEVKEVIPEMVSFADAYGLYTIVNYEQMFPVVVESIKEQQIQINLLRQEKLIAENGINSSDSRLKTDIKPILNVLQTLDQIKGVYHYWDTLNFADRNYSSEQALGLIAQDIQKVYPELVLEDKDGYLSVDYSKFTAVLLQAIKEQQILIDQQNQNNEKQQYQIEFLMEEVKQLKEKK